MCEIWANYLLPKALKSCPKSNKLPNLVTLFASVNSGANERKARRRFSRKDFEAFNRKEQNKIKLRSSVSNRYCTDLDDDNDDDGRPKIALLIKTESDNLKYQSM